MTKTDETGSTIAIRDNGIVRIDHIPAFILEWRRGEPWVKFCDRSKQRCELRGDKCVSVPLDALVARLMKECERRWQ